MRNHQVLIISRQRSSTIEPHVLHPASCSKMLKRTSKRLHTGVRKMCKKPVSSHLFNSQVSHIHKIASPLRATTTQGKTYSVEPWRSKATAVTPKTILTMAWITPSTLTSLSFLITLLSPSTSRRRKLPRPKYTVDRVVQVLVPPLALTFLSSLAMVAKLS